MSKLTPPSKKNIQKRLNFFLSNPTFPNARFEVFNLKNLMLNRDCLQGKLSKEDYIKAMDDLDRTQGWPDDESKKSEFVKLGDKMGLKI